ncbi:hypothetical protein A3F03_03555 [Candidatus Roizmanbacteria bacterium RIFCSPHIGHO2_12_FULL_41_11]|uniref:GH18 domain-containing protein n=3 Tax=Candidatus Roizmaniibacteriota TaxID=1752723 RepID=A0A1F7JRX7_9BACT|nr:MAG: hypothetical protein A3F03_03555 [Candidatus Roizmanbacteria bacterium RIFCSPHIGHO2_12_FULL_41_11]OGK51251.1 MAG: hypothetical protein A2966_03465 [Candidatus Roizmanbacteria bacterium RIFCSPLOWO2_01_FULL_41_22]OGK58390.1 MAG: hypothetical protein A3H86_02480 [Candidatus Roizmanbacteria bacterium RIFCSPLOWO2_02_FULL_41_9]
MNGDFADNLIYKPSKQWQLPVRIVFFSAILTILTINSIGIFIRQQRVEEHFVSPVVQGKENIAASTKRIVQQKKEVIGFLPSWMIAKEVKIEPRNLTQIIYFGLGANEQGELVKYDSQGNALVEWTYFTSDYFKALREEAKYSKTKMLLAITNFDNTSIDTLTSNPTAVDRLIGQLKAIIADYQLDGINLNFEYVSDTDFPTAKYLNLFLEKLTQELKKDKQNLIISFDVNATALMRDGAYDMVKIGELVDEVILMGYDYHRVNSSVAGPVAPIAGEANEHSIQESLRSLAGRVPYDKVVLGLPFYGYEWQTLNKTHKSITVTNTGALATYKRVKELIAARSDLQIHWDELAESPWLTYNQSGAVKQIYYENERSMTKKLELVNSKKMAGMAIWALGYEGEYPDLWTVINDWKSKLSL